MKPFEIVRPHDLKQATEALKGDAKLLAGGTDLLGEMKDYLITPTRLVNLKSVASAGLRAIAVDAKGDLKIGALVTLADLAAHPVVRSRFTALADAIDVTATPQIRNMATIAGNLCQRPRCWYYRDEHVHCLKKGGEMCYSYAGENQYHAILGGGPCYIVHPSDPAPALIALGASVVIAGGAKSRAVPLAQFFVLPEKDVRHETILKPGEIVTEVRIPAPAAGTRSVYRKEVEKDSFDWALCSAAVTLSRDPSGVVKAARIVLGGVAPIPWVAPAAAAALLGKPLSSASIAAAAKASVHGAAPLSHNAYKVPLTEAVVRIALEKLT